MKTKILIILLVSILFSCKNSSEETKGDNELASENTTQSTDESSMDGDDEVDGEEADMRSMISVEGILRMMESGQLSRDQANELLSAISKNNSNAMNTEGFDPEKFGDSLNNVLADLQESLESGGDVGGTDNNSLSTPNLFIPEKDRGITNFRKVEGIDRTQYIEERIRGYFGFSRQKRKQVTRSLASESITQEKVDAALLTFFEVSPNELELLKILPAAVTIISESQSKAARDYVLPKEISTIIESGAASENFMALVERFNYTRGSSPKKFLRKSKQSRDAFYKLNPGWYGGDDNAGDTYLDSHHNYIHLPLGNLSFADRVVSFEQKIKNGNHPQGAVGPPDLTKEHFRGAHPKICNLGTRGVLILEFVDNAIADVNGPDLFIFEMGAIEPTNLEISKDGQNWIDVGKIEGGTAMVDIAPFVKPKETFTYIRLTDLVTHSELPGADVDAVAAIGGALRLNLDSAVLFDTGRYQLKESASEALKKLLADIQEIPSGTIIVEGHTDNVGDPASNKTLSENRAREVSDYLKKNLSKNYKFQQKGFGESQPVAPNDSDENKQKNRRVEILVMPS